MITSQANFNEPRTSKGTGTFIFSSIDFLLNIDDGIRIQKELIRIRFYSNDLTRNNM